MSELHSAEKGAGTEYRVMWWDPTLERWFSHTGELVTRNRKTAEAWLAQSKSRSGPMSTLEPVIESRPVGTWTRVIAPGSEKP